MHFHLIMAFCIGPIRKKLHGRATQKPMAAPFKNASQNTALKGESPALNQVMKNVITRSITSDDNILNKTTFLGIFFSLKFKIKEHRYNRLLFPALLLHSE